MAEAIYKKVGKRYERVSEFYGEPTPGIWIVQQNTMGRSMRHIIRVGELPDAVPLLNLEAAIRNKVEEDVLASMMDKKDRWNISIVVSEVFKSLVRVGAVK